MTSAPTKVTYSSNNDNVSENRQFSLVDRFGRQIGAQAWLSTVTVHEAEFGFTNVKGFAEGQILFVFQPSATRNGAGYGASQPRQYFVTEAERAAAIAKYFIAAEKRAAKIH